MDAASEEARREKRHDLGHFVAPETLGCVAEGYMAVDISSRGMSLLRLTKSAGERALDEDHAWFAVPVPGAGRYVSALGEIVHRRGYGPLQKLGVRFQYIAPEDRQALDQWLGSLKAA